MREDVLPAGVEAGLRFASVMDGRGGCVDLDWRGVARWRPEDGFLWIHLERDTEEAARWVQSASGVDSLVAEALLADETRPRIEPFDHGLLLVLRGVNLAEREDLDLVPIHIWIDQDRAITLRDREHALSALREIRLALKAGRGPRGAGGLLVQISDKIVRDLEPALDDLDGEVERLEDEILGSASHGLRQRLGEVRRRSIHLRRYLCPQREALRMLRIEEAAILDDRDRMRLSGVIDRIVRFLEDLDAIRDRTTILQEELAAQLSERIAHTSNRLTGVAALLLPPGLIAGLLGANIGGIPGEGNPWAFSELIGLILLLMVIQWGILRRIHWL